MSWSTQYAKDAATMDAFDGTTDPISIRTRAVGLPTNCPFESKSDIEVAAALSKMADGIETKKLDELGMSDWKDNISLIAANPWTIGAVNRLSYVLKNGSPEAKQRVRDVFGYGVNAIPKMAQSLFMAQQQSEVNKLLLTPSGFNAKDPLKNLIEKDNIFGTGMPSTGASISNGAWVVK